MPYLHINYTCRISPMENMLFKIEGNHTVFLNN
jgi:hypothetical protein